MKQSVLRLLAVASAGYAGLTVVFVAVGMAVTDWTALSAVVAVDRRVAGWIAGHRVDMLDTVFSGFSSLADTWTVIGVLSGAAAILISQRRWWGVSVLATGVSVEFLVFLSTSFTVDRPRPAVALGDLPVTGSFPSGHAAVAVVLYGAVAHVVRSTTASRRGRRIASASAIALAAAVAVSRLYFGLHYASDILAGIALGLAGLRVAVIAASEVPGRFRTPPLEFGVDGRAVQQGDRSEQRPDSEPEQPGQRPVGRTERSRQ